MEQSLTRTLTPPRGPGLPLGSDCVRHTPWMGTDLSLNDGSEEFMTGTSHAEMVASAVRLFSAVHVE